MSSSAPPDATSPEPDAPHERTAWHLILAFAVGEVLSPQHWRTDPEHPLNRESLRIDVLVARRPGALTPPPAVDLMVNLLGDLAPHTLIHFVGPTDALNRDDALALLAYAILYRRYEKVRDIDAIGLRLLAPWITPRFREELKALGGELDEEGAEGVYEGRLGPFKLRVIEARAMRNSTRDWLLYTFSPDFLKAPRVPTDLTNREMSLFRRTVRQIEQIEKEQRTMPTVKDTEVAASSYRKALLQLMIRETPPEDLLRELKTEDILSRLKTEDILPHIKTEERLRDLSPEQAILALPDSVLRGFSKEYLATLPADVQKTIRKRLRAVKTSR